MNIEDESILYGLLYDCPFGEELPDCPLHEIREFPFEERYEIVQRMTTDEIENWLAHHRQCICRRS